jgi:hypothetical protein
MFQITITWGRKVPGLMWHASENEWLHKDLKSGGILKTTLFFIHTNNFCILFIWTLSIVQFNKITTFQRLALSPSSGDQLGSPPSCPFLLSPEDGDRASLWNVVILLNCTMDNVQINKMQKCNAPSSISFRCIFTLIMIDNAHDDDDDN